MALLAPRSPGRIVLEHVSRRLGGTTVLDDVNLRLPPGSVSEVVGNNGVGKTSLLRIVAGTLAPDEGRVEVVGLPPGRGMAALVPAGDRALFWRLTAQQELEFFARVAGNNRKEAEDLAAAAAAALMVSCLAKTQIGTLSTGQRRRLMVARSLVGLAPVLLLDEPYADLDDSACETVAAAARSWTHQGGVVLWAAPKAGSGPTPDARFRLAGGRLQGV